MSDALFQIIFRGKLLSGVSIEQARSNLAQLFRTDEQRIGAMLAQPKWVIKNGITKETAQKFQEALRNAGLMVVVMAEETNPVEQATRQTSSAPVLAPSVAVIVAEATSTEAQSPPADTPLAQAPKIAAFVADLSAFSLADVGAIMDASTPKKAERDFALDQFSLAAPGAQLIEKKPVNAKQIDTSAMALVPAVIPVKTKLSALQREMED